MLEPNEKPTEIITVLIDPVVAFFYLWLLQVADHFLFQLPTPFSRNDLKNRDAPVNTELHCIVKCLIDLFAFVEDIVEIEFVFGHRRIASLAGREPVNAACSVALGNQKIHARSTRRGDPPTVTARKYGRMVESPTDVHDTDDRLQ